ncbi:MAG TPA: hypothetical protein VK015_00230, partial [Microbacterium sp.]|nr:hypothetical protein [Microbacterium sp.]
AATPDRPLVSQERPFARPPKGHLSDTNGRAVRRRQDGEHAVTDPRDELTSAGAGGTLDA